MARTARFHLSRLTKSGVLEQGGVVQALLKATELESRRFSWTIIDAEKGRIAHHKTRHEYCFGRLVKYDPKAFVEVVDAEERQVKLHSEPNLQLAASDFVYFPQNEVFGHRKVWNHIRPSDFRRQLGELIESYHKKFFVECKLQPVTDYRMFVQKLAELDQVSKLKAAVSPPNPLFSPFWKDLKDYLLRRRLRSMKIQESGRAGEGLLTAVPEIAKQIVEDTIEIREPAEIGDAAVLMAADGYGTAEVSGRRGKQVVVVRTADSELQLKLAADITATELARAILNEIMRVEHTRKLKH